MSTVLAPPLPMSALRPGVAGLARLGGLGLVGGLAAAVGWFLRGSGWIDPSGVTAAGVALVLVAPYVRTSLDLLVVLTPFMFRTLSPVGVLNFGTSDVVVVAVVLMLVMTGLLASQRSGVAPDRFGVGLALGATTVMLGSLVAWVSVSPDFAVGRALSDTLKLLIGMTYLALVVHLVHRVGQEGAVRALVLWSRVATGVAAASVLGAVAGLDLVPSDGSRSLGFFADPNLYAAYLLLSLAILVFRGVTRPSPWLPVQALVITAGVVTTGSRGGLLTLVLLIVFTLLMVGSVRVRLTLLLLTALMTVAGWVLLSGQEAGEGLLGVDRLMVSSAESGDDARIALWRLAGRLWLEHPMFGIGMGQYPRFSVGIVGETSADTFGHVVHNSFLNVLVSLGVVGLAVFLLLIGWVMRTLVGSSGLTRNQKFALAGGLLVIVAQMMTLNLENLRYVWIYFGMVIGLARLHEC